MIRRHIGFSQLTGDTVNKTTRRSVPLAAFIFSACGRETKSSFRPLINRSGIFKKMRVRRELGGEVDDATLLPHHANDGGSGSGGRAWTTRSA